MSGDFWTSDTSNVLVQGVGTVKESGRGRSEILGGVDCNIEVEGGREED